MSPGRRHAIIRINAGILLIELLGANFCEILIKKHTLSLNEMHLEISPAKRRQCFVGLHVLILLSNAIYPI